jgi:inosine-uridine nucleoside N-ribohydrolase
LPQKTSIILDTDNGTDIDDTWALAMLLRSPELDTKLIVTDTGDTLYPQVCQRAFTAPWDITITLLDTCGLDRLTGTKYQAIVSSKAPLTQATTENYRIWAANAKWASELDVEAESSSLFDTVAIYLAFSKKLLKVEQLGIRVTDDGYTVVDERAKAINCAVDWKNLSAFEDLLVRRLM